MSEADKPDLSALAQMRETMMKRLEEDEGDQMEGLSLERLRDAMYRPNALEVMSEIFGSGPGAASVGMNAPDFELPYLPGRGGREGETVLLSDHFGKHPVGLIFGSYT